MQAIHRAAYEVGASNNDALLQNPYIIISRSIELRISNAVNGAVNGAVCATVRDAVSRAVYRAVDRAVRDAVDKFTK
jgi:hypothetical protein